MYRLGDKIILTNIQGLKSIDFVEDDTYEDEAYLEFTFTEMRENIIIPRTFYVLTEDSLNEYNLLDAVNFNAFAGQLSYSAMGSFALTDKGKEQYNLYCMMYNDGDKDNKQINIDEFIEQYTY